MTYKKTKLLLADFNYELGAKPGVMQSVEPPATAPAKKKQHTLPDMDGPYTPPTTTTTTVTPAPAETHTTTPIATKTTTVNAAPAAKTTPITVTHPEEKLLANGAITYKDGDTFKEATVDKNGRAHDAKGKDLEMKDIYINVVMDGKALHPTLKEHFKATEKLPANLKFTPKEASELLTAYEQGVSSDKKIVIQHHADQYDKKTDNSATITAAEIEKNSSGVEDIEKDANNVTKDVNSTQSKVKKIKDGVNTIKEFLHR